MREMTLGSAILCDQDRKGLGDWLGIEPDGWGWQKLGIREINREICNIDILKKVKPMFHQKMNPLALGHHIGHEQFALSIPTSW